METISGKIVQIPRKSLQTDNEHSVADVPKNGVVDEYVNCTTLPSIKVNKNIDWESRDKVESVS